MKMKFTLVLILTFLSGCFFAQDNEIDDRNPVAMIKAAIIFQFAYQCEWPKSESTDFWIGVYNNDEIYEQLMLKYATQPIGSQVLKIKKIENLEDCSSVQILYIDKSSSADLKQARKEIGNNSVLLISDVDNAIDAGAIVGFVIEDNKTKFELNEKEAAKRQISIGNMLKEWAVKKD